MPTDTTFPIIQTRFTGKDCHQLIREAFQTIRAHDAHDDAWYKAHGARFFDGVGHLTRVLDSGWPIVWQLTDGNFYIIRDNHYRQYMGWDTEAVVNLVPVDESDVAFHPIFIDER